MRACVRACVRESEFVYVCLSVCVCVCVCLCVRVREDVCTQWGAKLMMIAARFMRDVLHKEVVL